MADAACPRLATTFVPIDGFHSVLHTIASWNPISSLAAAVRELFGNPTATPTDAPWPLQHPIAVSVGWCLLMIAIAIPTTIRLFRRRTET